MTRIIAVALAAALLALPAPALAAEHHAHRGHHRVVHSCKHWTHVHRGQKRHCLERR